MNLTTDKVCCPLSNSSDTLFDLPGRLLETTNYVTRDNCGNWMEYGPLLSVVADSLIGFAYLFLAFLIAFSRHIFGRSLLPTKLTTLLFSVFIFWCGIGHILEALTFHVALYDHGLVVDMLTAFACLAAIPVSMWWCREVAETRRSNDTMSRVVRELVDNRLPAGSAKINQPTTKTEP